MVTLAIGAAIALGAGFLVPKAMAGQERPLVWQEPQAAAQQNRPEAPAGERPAPLNQVSVGFAGEFLGWSMRDRQTGVVTGDNMDQTSSTESMVKTWLVADFLRRATKTPTATQLDQAEEAIRWSDDEAAQTLYVRNGGDSSIQRMIDMCGLTETTVYDGWWSRTEMSPRDAVLLGECLVNGTAAGPVWTDWLLDQMRHVSGSTAPDDQEASRGGGRWGIIDGVPSAEAGRVAIKNGWTEYNDNWHLNCLAVTSDWTMAVMMRYPSNLGLEYGADICESVAQQLLT